MEKIWQSLWKRKKKKLSSQDVEMEESDNKENDVTTNTAKVADKVEENVEEASPQKVNVKSTGMLRMIYSV